MGSTPGVNLPYPDRYADPWFATFESFANAVDAGILAAREDRNTLAYSTAIFSYNSGTLTWSGEIALINPKNGTVARVAAGSIAVSNGHYAYVALPRASSVDTAPTVVSAAVLPNNDTAFVLGIRVVSTAFMLRNGHVLYDGEAAAPFFKTGQVPTFAAAIKSGETIAVGALVEPHTDGTLKNITSTSTKCAGVALIGGTGNGGGTVYALVQCGGLAQIVVKSGSSVVAGSGVKPSSTLHHVDPTSAVTDAGRVGIALKSLTGNGTDKVPVVLSLTGA